MTKEFQKQNRLQEHIRWEEKQRGLMTENELRDHLAAGVLDWAEFKQLVHEEIVFYLRQDEFIGSIIPRNENDFLNDEEVIDAIRGMRMQVMYLKGETDRLRKALDEKRIEFIEFIEQSQRIMKLGGEE